jgi:Ca2+-binding EF-hand superfamily protein
MISLGASLAEIDLAVKNKYPLLNHKPALMRAYKRTTAKIGGGDGDDYVERHEVGALLENLVFYNRLFKVFDDLDTGDDRRVDFDEFKVAMKRLGTDMDEEAAREEFETADKNGGGIMLFDEFCEWFMAKEGMIVATPESAKAEEKEEKKTKQKRASADFDNDPKLMAREFNPVHNDVQDIIGDEARLDEMWASMDVNDNGGASLAEVDKAIVAQYPILDHKPALMRAYKRTTSRAGGGDGDDFVERKELASLLQNLVLYNKLFAVFDDIDSGDDRRVDFDEFKVAMKRLGMHMNEEKAKIEFDSADKNGPVCPHCYDHPFICITIIIIVIVITITITITVIVAIIVIRWGHYAVR